MLVFFSLVYCCHIYKFLKSHLPQVCKRLGERQYIKKKNPNLGILQMTPVLLHCCGLDYGSVLFVA